jgi:secreted trypsin-like serine protease
MGIKNLLNLLATSTTVFANVATQNERNDTTRIIGGVPARAGEFPSMVSVQLNYRGHICGGALLDSTTVLTAAHCPGAIRMYGYTASNMAVRAGSLVSSS